jgi:hypothetical protein
MKMDLVRRQIIMTTTENWQKEQLSIRTRLQMTMDITENLTTMTATGKLQR